MPYRGHTTVLTMKVDRTDPRYLGDLGHVVPPKWSYTVPGGCDQFSCQLQADPRKRAPALDPGRILWVLRGADVVWDGQLDEPTPSAEGWDITAHGSGTFGSQYMAQWTGAWASVIPDTPVDNAISRGLRWVNPGLGQPSGIWLGQKVDSASTTIADLLDLVTSHGGLIWHVQRVPRGNIVRIDPIPTAPTRLLVAGSPVARTLGGDINVVWERYQSAPDLAKTPATYATTSSTDAASIARYGRTETYVDLSSAGVMAAGDAQTIGNYVLRRYTRASFAGPFEVQPGQLLTTRGVPVDLGCYRQANEGPMVCQLVMSDLGYGGEVTDVKPVTFMVGGYEYDDAAQTATITPFESMRTDFASLLAARAETAHGRRVWTRWVTRHHKRRQIWGFR